VQPGDPDPLLNTATVHYHPDGFPNDITDAASWRVDLVQPGLRLTKTCDPLSKVGDQIACVVTILNTSTAGSPDLILDSFVDTKVPGVVPPAECSPLAAGASCTINYIYTVLPTDPDPVVNTATAHYHPVGLVNDVSDTAFCSANLFQPSLDLTKVCDAQSKVGDQVACVVTIQNTSSADSPNLILDSFVDTRVPGAVPPAACSPLAPGASCTISYSYAVLPSDPDPVINTATAHYHPDGFPNDISGAGSWSTDLLHPDYTVTKTCTTPLVDPGKNAVYSIVFANTGDVDLIVVPDEDLTLANCAVLIPAGTPFTLEMGTTETYYHCVVAGNRPSVDNTVNASATLPPVYGLPNVLPRSSSGSCMVSASKSGYKWHDLNRDGVWDASEPGMNGWRIELRDAQGNLLQYTTTSDFGGKAGYYSFSSLPPGSYIVNEVCQPAWFQSYPEAPSGACGKGVHRVTLVGGQVDTGNNFGNFQAEVPEASTLILVASGLAGLASYAGLQIRARRRAK